MYISYNVRLKATIRAHGGAIDYWKRHGEKVMKGYQMYV
jgi:hypothetical protein